MCGVRILSYIGSGRRHLKHVFAPVSTPNHAPASSSFRGVPSGFHASSYMKLLRSALSLVVFTTWFATGFAVAQTPAPPPSLARPEAGEPEKIAIPGINLTHGPAVVKLGTVAEIKLPEGFAFVGPDSLDQYYALNQNTRSGDELGVVISPENWELHFDFDEVGYVKDDDKDKLDATKLYQSIQEGMAAGNEERRARGWSEFKLQGWMTPPRYDEKTNNLTWAFKLSSSRDNHQRIGLNEKIRLLGRTGVMNVTLVADVEGFQQTEAAAQALLTQFSYVSGAKYAEYKKGDKLAEYGLAALVVGGAGAIAVKAGLLGFLGKFWKAIAVGVAAVGAGLVRVWNKITGRNPPQQ
jgi:uncharacterized membrane-anchored protein